MKMYNQKSKVYFIIAFTLQLPTQYYTNTQISNAFI